MTTDITNCCLRSNCETFCNLILFNYTESTQTAETVSCIRSKISQFFERHQKSKPTSVQISSTASTASNAGGQRRGFCMHRSDEGWKKRKQFLKPDKMLQNMWSTKIYLLIVFCWTVFEPWFVFVFQPKSSSAKLERILLYIHCLYTVAPCGVYQCYQEFELLEFYR